MDKVPQGAGMPGGAGVDGAFERFLTAAIATIITIMFSWRLLAEEEEAMGSGVTGSGIAGLGARPARPFSLPQNYRPLSTIPAKTTKPNVLQQTQLKQTTAQRSTGGICEIDISDDESSSYRRESRSTDVDAIMGESVVYDEFIPSQRQQLQATSTNKNDVSDSSNSVPSNLSPSNVTSSANTDDNLTVDTLTTWDEYKWEEETGDEEEFVIKTRRNVRSFARNPNALSPNSPNTSSTSETSPDRAEASVSLSVPFSQRFADFVPDAGGDSGYIDLYPDVESDSDVTDSSDDERVYEIQVSDSDSDSEGDARNSGFFGMTSLDTIIEEYESDASETGDVTEKKTCSKVDAKKSKIEPPGVSSETVKLLNSSVDKGDSSSHCDKDCDNYANDDRYADDCHGNYRETDIDTGVSLLPNVKGTKTDVLSSTEVLLGQADDKTTCQNETTVGQNDIPSSSMKATGVECNLPLDKTQPSQSNSSIPDKLMGKKLHHDSSVNQDSQIYTPVTEVNIQPSLNQPVQEANSQPEINPSPSSKNSCNPTPTEGHLSTAEANISYSKPAKPDPINLKNDDYKISEISDDSLPASPIRTCALDTLADEPFSDTESCSSGSVITVLSIQSTDSENRDKQTNFAVNKGETPSGKNKNPLLSVDQNNDSMGKYDNFSLVSGFLNDSLNSLLSANTGSEKDSSSDLESSGQEVTSQNEQRTSENQAPVHVNGKLTSDDSNVSSNESLPAVQEIVHQNEQIPVNDNVNGHTTSSDSLNTDNADAMNINSDVIPDYIDSDSSDSSDPPLREYDPRDDDLAAFQFNLDSDDDSFFLVIGGDSDVEDDGRLRNFETFTNLNSVGLAADYGDAVTSRTLSDDGKSFTFSQTEEVDTQFKKRGYFLDREVASSPNLGPLSPIISEDEELKPEELPPTGNDAETVAKESPVKSSTYDDAECSMPSRANDNIRDSAIDFNKYIIKSDLSPVTKNFPDFPAQNAKSSAMVERAKTNNDHTSIIDNEGDKMNNLGENVLNYSGPLDRPAETLSGSNSNDKIESSHELLSGHSGTPDSKLCSDLPSETSDANTQNDSSQKLDLNSPQKRETNIDDIFETNVKSPEKVSSPKKKDKVETLIDDIFDFGDDSGNDNVNIDDILIANTEKKTRFVQPKTIKRSHRRSSPLKETQSKHETNIDDIFTSESTNQKVETNVDELFEPELAHRTSAPIPESKPRKETTIDLPDVVCDVNRNADVKKETCFDVTSDISGDTVYKHFVDILSSQTNDLPEVTSESAILGVSEPLSPVKSVHVENDPIRAQNVNNNELPTNINNDFSSNHSSELKTHQNKFNNVTSDTDLAVDRTRDNLDLQTIENQTAKPPREQPVSSNYGQACEQIEKPSGSSDNESGSYEDKIIAENIEKVANNYVATPPHIDTKYEQNNSHTLNKPLLQGNLDSTNLEQTDYNVKVSLPKTETLNSSIGSSGSGEIPEDYTTQDRKADKPVVQNLPASKNVDLDLSTQEHLNTDFEHSYVSVSDNERGVSFHDVEDSILSEDGVKTDSEKDNRNNETELKIDENSFVDAVEEFDDKQLDSISSCSHSVELSDDESLSSFEESYHNIQATYNAIQARKLAYSPDGRVVRTPLQKPSELFGKAKDLKGVKRRVHRHQLKKYTSVLQQPITSDKTYVHVELPERPASVSRLKVQKSRERFLSEENLLSDSFEDKFIKHRTSLVSSTPRKYLKRHERDLQSTESLPTDMSAWNTSYGSNLSIDHVHSLPVPMRIEELYNSRYSSHNSSFEHSEYDKLHANCMFSPGKREQIEELRHSTKSLENMFEQLLRYGSVSSDMETDLDAPDYQDPFISFQYPLERAASMSALVGSSETVPRPAKKTGKGRFANRKVPKSKSLQTLETNLDDVFADELGQSGELKKTPSVHELRVSKSLSKLNVPDWFRKSSFSRAGSTQSLFTYAGRTGSTSTLGSFGYPPSLTTSPTPSVTPGGNTVIIQKRVTPSPTTPTTSKVLRAPLLPTTPEKAPIHDIPSATLPSDKYRKQECKSLKPIPILPFAKIREMFEKKAQETAADATTPTREKPSPTKDFPRGSPTKGSPTKDKSQRVHFEPSEIPTISEPKDNGHVESNRTSSPPPPLPERKPILTDTTKHSDSSNSQSRKQQVHFSDEKSEKKVSKPQEQKVDSKRQNGSTPSTSSSTVKKPSGLRAALPLPQFRFRRPGSYATKVATSNTQNSTTTQSKKGKNIDFYDDYDYYGEYQVNNDMSPTSPPPAWLHALELKARTDGETLFEFLQKRRYSSILENGFAEQMDELQDKDVIFNFPVMAVSNHSSNGDMNGSSDLRVVLTNAHNHAVQNGFLNNKLRSDAPKDDILDGLLLLDGYQTGRMRMNGNDLIVPKSPDSLVQSPDTPPGFAFLHPGIVENEYLNSEDEEALFGPYDNQSEYVLVKCENPTCPRETNLREAKKYFKSCHSCFTYYCSRKCRKVHWSPHKLVCVYSRINSACKHVIKFINKHPHLQYQCSRIARRGYLSQGRGCVVFAFPDIGSADDFLTSGMESLWVPPVYISLKELPNAVMLGSQLHILTETCKKYNPELKYVIHVTIVIPQQLPYRPVPRKMDAIIQRCAKLRLSAAHMHPKQEDSNVPSTLILTAVPGNQHADESDGRKTRELCFVNIQRKLRQRNVSLRHQFTEVYNRLIDFVSDAKHFSPMIIYPTDGRSGKRFMCVIMPEAEPEIEWIRDPDLFHELDVFEDEDTETSSPSYTIQHEVML